MPFPMLIGARSLAAAPDLAAAFIEDASAGGGTVVPERSPSQWVLGAVEAGALEREVAVGLAAAVLRSRQAASVAEGARLAAGLAHPRLTEMLAQALVAYDVGLLLHADPVVPGQSVEDALLHAWAATADLSNPGARGELLARLRNAGLHTLERAVLTQHASPAEIRRWFPETDGAQ
jgi:hypothetical protein